MGWRFAVEVTALPWLPLCSQRDRTFYHSTWFGKYLQLNEKTECIWNENIGFFSLECLNCLLFPILFIIYSILKPDRGIYWNNKTRSSHVSVHHTSYIRIHMGKRDVCARMCVLSSALNPIRVTSFMIIIIYKYDEQRLTSRFEYTRGNAYCAQWIREQIPKSDIQ